MEIVSIDIRLKDMSYRLKQAFVNSVFGGFTVSSTKITSFATNASGARISVGQTTTKVVKSSVGTNQQKTPIVQQPDDSDEGF